MAIRRSKPHSVLFLFLLGMALFVSLACNRSISVGPTQLPTPTPTSTPTTTPGCGFTAHTIPTPASPSPTPIFYPLPIFLPTPVTTYPMPGTNLVIRNQTDWEAYYGVVPAPPPPVDFSAEMLLVNLQVAQYGFGYTATVEDVCWDDTGFTVNASLYFHCTSGLPPPYVYYKVAAVSVPLSDLPVTWNVTSMEFQYCPPCYVCATPYGPER